MLWILVSFKKKYLACFLFAHKKGRDGFPYRHPPHLYKSTHLAFENLHHPGVLCEFVLVMLRKVAHWGRVASFRDEFPAMCHRIFKRLYIMYLHNNYTLKLILFFSVLEEVKNKNKIID